MTTSTVRPSSGSSKPAVSASNSSLTISLSAVIASLWAGIWGFDWAATHLDPGALFITILIGLAIGAYVTFYLTRETFQVVKSFEAMQHELEMKELEIEDYRARHGQPASPTAPPFGHETHIDLVKKKGPMEIPDLDQER